MEEPVPLHIGGEIMRDDVFVCTSKNLNFFNDNFSLNVCSQSVIITFGKKY